MSHKAGDPEERTGGRSLTFTPLSPVSGSHIYRPVPGGAFRGALVAEGDGWLRGLGSTTLRHAGPTNEMEAEK